MSWLDEYTGFIVHDNASPVGAVRMTVNGGYTWKDITTITNPANSGLNAIFAINNNLAMFAGEANAATGFLGKVSLLFDSFD
jgi:photosystem II stability/assembly factor-like uncharacterized protein